MAVGWSGYFVSFLRDLGLAMPPALTAAPGVGAVAPTAAGDRRLQSARGLDRAAGDRRCWSIGIRQSANTNTVLVMIKIVVLIVFVALGAAYVRRENLTPFMPPNTGEFGHFGWSGILRGAGGDVLRLHRLRRRLDRRAGGARTRSATCRSASSRRSRSARSSTSRSRSCSRHRAVSAAQRRRSDRRRIDATGLTWFSPVIKVSALFGLFSTMLVQLLGQTRIFYSMSRDGLLPRSVRRGCIRGSGRRG